MPTRIIRQPNGLLARFTTVSDAVTDYDMTAQEAYLRCCEDMASHEAARKVQRGLEDDLVGLLIDDSKKDGLDRWRDAVHTMGLVHGKDAVADLVATMDEGSFDPGKVVMGDAADLLRRLFEATKGEQGLEEIHVRQGDSNGVCACEGCTLTREVSKFLGVS